MAEQAYAYVTLIPNAKGFQSAVATEMAGVDGIGATAGANMSRGFASSFGSTIKSFIGPAFATAAIYGVKSFVSSAVEESSAFGESANAIKVAFGDAADEIGKLGSTAANRLGLSSKDFNQIATQFSAFSKTIAGDSGNVVTVVDELSTRGADFASVFNLDVADALGLFQSGLAGETEPLRKFGIDLSAAAVEAYALENGIATAGKQMTEQEKVQARYGLLMEQTAMTQGDFANTSEGLANSQRILGANMDELKRIAGDALVPAFAALTTAMIPVVQELAPVLAETFKSLTPVIESLVTVLPGILIAIMPLFPVLAQLIAMVAEIAVALMPAFVDIINLLMPVIVALVPPVLSMVQALLPLIPAILAIIKAFLPLITAILPVVTQLITSLVPVIVMVSDIISGVLKIAIGILIGAFELLMPIIKTVGDVFRDVFTGVGDFLKGILNSMAGWLEGFINFFIDGINTIIKGINILADSDPTGLIPNIKTIPKAKFPRMFAEGGFVTGPTNAIIGEAGPEVVVPLDRFERMMGMDNGEGGNGKSINYYAAPNQSIDSEQALFMAMRRAKVVGAW